MHILIKVNTGSKKGKIEEVKRSEIDGRSVLYDKNLKYFKVNLKNQPRDNKANEEMSDILSNYFKVPKSRILIKSGGSSKLKLIEIK